MAVLVTGGAGYIGSQMSHALLDRGQSHVVIDNLSTGSKSALSASVPLVIGEIADTDLVRRIIRDNGIDAVIHFAASVVVPESVASPLKYYANNTVASHKLIEVCVEEGVRNFVFSSTAAVYGATESGPVTEAAPTRPCNPYGRSKLMTECMLEDVSKSHDLRYVVLRYFNVAGADPMGRTGQLAADATHLVKRACQAALGRIPLLEVFGTDYPTPDGTGVRDYVHVADLIAAHLLALDALVGGAASDVFNCGYGHGVSVLDVIRAAERACGHPLSVRFAPRRAGDPPFVVSDSTKLKQRFGWEPRYDDIDAIISSALAWERRAAG